MTVQKALYIFQLNSLSSTDEKSLKKRYLKLAKVMHPDVVGKSGEQAFKELGIAYAILKNALNNPLDLENVQTNTVNNAAYSKVNYVTFENLINDFKNHDAQKFNSGTWVIRFKLKFTLAGNDFELMASAHRNKKDEYSLVVHLPYEAGDNLKLDFYGFSKELTLSDIGSKIFINYDYLAKITIHIMKDSDTGGN